MASSLADHIRALPDDGLGALVRLRPDLVVPVPADLSALASRAQSRVSVARALDGLDQFTLEMLDGLRLVADERRAASIEALFALTADAGLDPARVRAAIDRLRERMLVYGLDGTVRIVPAVDELTSPYPAGLGRPAADLDPDVAELVADPAGLRRTLLSAPPEARAVLDRLAAGPPVGSVQAGSLAPKAAGESPVRWLVQHRLLVAIADDLVELPREVGLVLRRETGPLGPLHPEPPSLADAPVRPGADSAGAGQALEAVRQVETLLTRLADSPAPVLKSFGLGARDLRRLAKEADVSEDTAALLVEIAYAAGLLTYTDRTVRTGDQVWLPAPAFDTWRGDALARRWALLARSWLRMTRAPAQVGLRDFKDKLINALSPEVERPAAPRARRAVLGILAELAPGTAPGVEAVLARLAWISPRRAAEQPSGPPPLHRAALAEAAALGITGLDALTSYGRLLFAETGPRDEEDPLGIRAGEDLPADRVVAALDALVPAPIDHVLVQADLTVVVPGPPEPALAAELAMLAESESRGGAGVYRITPATVRRALDAGYAAADIHALLRRRSRTPLPQALEYLIDDVARKHGGLRVSTAGAYLRGEDEALIGEVFADRRLTGLSLRRLAPTVLATPHPVSRLLQELRDAGYAPVPEDATGAMVLTRPKAARAPARPAPHPGRGDDFDPRHLTAPRVAAIVEQLRLGDRVARAARRSSEAAAPVGPDGVPLKRSQAHTEALNTLVQALRDQARVWVGYVDAQGTTAAKLVRPVSMGSGYLRAEDDRTETLHTFALHRITSAVLDE
jgi:hypothetical protein